MMPLKVVFIASVLCLTFGTTFPKSLDRNEVVLRKHLAEVKGILDETQDPCNDFAKYACGRYQKVSGGQYPNSKVHFSEILAELQGLTDIKLESTKQAKHFIESCQKHRVPKDILQKVDLLKNPSDFKLARVVGALGASGVSMILKTIISPLEGNQFRVAVVVDPKLFSLDEESIKGNLSLLGVSGVDVEKNIIAFINKGQSIVRSDESYLEGADVNVIKNFNWDEFISELKKLPHLSNANIQFALRDITKLQKIIDLVSVTDVQVLRLLAAVQIMSKASEFDCDSIIRFFMLPILAEFNRLHFTDEDKALNLAVLDGFEKSHSIKKWNQSTGSLVRVQEKRKTIENIGNFFDGQKIDAEFKDVHFESDNFFQNYLYLVRIGINQQLTKGESNDAAKLEYLSEVLSPVYRMKPPSFHFASQGVYFWELYYRTHGHRYDSEGLRNCLTTQQEEFNLTKLAEFSTFDYVTEFSAIKQTYEDFKRFVADRTSDHTAVYTEFNLNRDQVFFLNIAQRICRKVDFAADYQFRVLLNLNDVTNAFNCPLGSKLNMPGRCASG